MKEMVKWAKKKAKKGKADFKYWNSGDLLEIAVVHEDGEWCVWLAKVLNDKSGFVEPE